LTVDTQPEKEQPKVKGGPANAAGATKEAGIKVNKDIEVTNKEVAACCVIA
jgi:hypothetical protein